MEQIGKHLAPKTESLQLLYLYVTCIWAYGDILTHISIGSNEDVSGLNSLAQKMEPFPSLIRIEIKNRSTDLLQRTEPFVDKIRSNKLETIKFRTIPPVTAIIGT